MQNKTAQTVGFFLLLLLTLILAAALVQPFFQVLAFAGILAVLFLPLHEFFVGKTKSDTLAAFLSVGVILFIVGIPLYFLSQAAVSEMLAFYGRYKEGGVKIDSQFLVNNLPPLWQQTGEHFVNEAFVKLSSWVGNFTVDIAGIVSNIAGFFFSCFLLFFIVFYFLKDHEKLKRYLSGLFPLSASNEDLLINKVIGAVNGMVKGSFLMALMQGAAAVIGFLLSGVPQPLFWGMVTVLSAFVPTVGTSLVIIPAIIYLLLFKSFTATLILVVWYVLVNISLDTIVGPKVLGRHTHLHPLLVLFSVLGGIEFFGPLGFLFGPIIMAVFLALVDVYRTNYNN